MSLRIVFVGLLFFILSLDVPAWGEGVIGTWATDGDKSHVEIAPCGLKFCGIIVWLKEPLDGDGKLKHDANNPNKNFARPFHCRIAAAGQFCRINRRECMGGRYYL